MDSFFATLAENISTDKVRCFQKSIGDQLEAGGVFPAGAWAKGSSSMNESMLAFLLQYLENLEEHLDLRVFHTGGGFSPESSRTWMTNHGGLVTAQITPGCAAEGWRRAPSWRLQITSTLLLL